MIAQDLTQRFMDPEIHGINPLLSALETLRTDPQNEAHQEQVIKAFDEFGPLQGVALTYAPYLNIFCFGCSVR